MYLWAQIGASPAQWRAGTTVAHRAGLELFPSNSNSYQGNQARTTTPYVIYLFQVPCHLKKEEERNSWLDYLKVMKSLILKEIKRWTDRPLHVCAIHLNFVESCYLGGGIFQWTWGVFNRAARCWPKFPIHVHVSATQVWQFLSACEHLLCWKHLSICMELYHT